MNILRYCNHAKHYIFIIYMIHIISCLGHTKNPIMNILRYLNHAKHYIFVIYIGFNIVSNGSCFV